MYKSKLGLIFVACLFATTAMARDINLSELRACHSAAVRLETEGADLKSEGDQLENDLMALNIRASFLQTRHDMINVSPYNGQINQTYNNDVNQYQWDQSNYNQKVRSRNSRLQALKARATSFENDCGDGEATVDDIDTVCGNVNDKFCNGLK